MFRTRTKTGAGKHAKYDEVFYIDDYYQAIKGGGINGNILFEAFDEDELASDFLGCAQPLPL